MNFFADAGLMTLPSPYDGDTSPFEWGGEVFAC